MSNRNPQPHEKRPLTPAVMATLTSLAVALAMSILLHFWILPPWGMMDGKPLRADLMWMAQWAARNASLGRSSNPEWIVLNALHATWQDFDIYFHIQDQVRQRLTVVALAGALSMPLTFMTVFSSTRVLDTRKHHAGRRFFFGEAGLASAAAQFAKEIAQYGRGLLLAPGLPISRMRELRNILIIGAPNSGKTRIILYLIEQLLGRFATAPDTTRILIHDTTGEIHAGVPLPDTGFAAIGLRGTGIWSWAIGRDIRSPIDAMSFSQRLIRSHSGSASGENKVFDDGGVVCMTGCVLLAHHRHKWDWSAAELLAIALLDPLELREAFLRVYPPAASLLLVDPESGALSRTSASFMLTFQAHVLGILSILAQAWSKVPKERRFSFVDWLNGKKGQPGIVILRRSARHARISATWIGAVIDLVAAHSCDDAYNRNRKMRIHFVLDEIYQLGAEIIDGFQQVLDVGRNKNISTIAAYQDLNQARIVGGDHRARAFEGRFATKIFGQMPQGAEAQEASRFIGTRTILNALPKPGEALPKEVVPVLDADIIEDDFGPQDDEIRAAILGAGDVIEATWPIRVWQPRRPE